jgi:hypothetical protein
MRCATHGTYEGTEEARSADGRARSCRSLSPTGAARAPQPGVRFEAPPAPFGVPVAKPAKLPSASSPTHPLGDAVETFLRREDAERFTEDVRGDDVELAS